MANIQASFAPWRAKLLPASYNGVPFHVEQQARNSGRRIVLHEYPKRDSPYAEDMGKHAIRYNITGYIVGPTYFINKMALIAVLESASGGVLIDPYLGFPLLAVCERYSVTETRERGGYCTFEMVFAQAGTPGNAPSTDTGAAANASADNASNAAANSTNSAALSPGSFDEAGFIGAFDTGGQGGIGHA
jgi:prophage DNA circulation protein